MCGISGLISYNNYIDVDLLQRMNSLIKHRGPDDEGYLLIKEKDLELAYGDDSIEQIKQTAKNVKELSDMKYTIGLGHRRLSILELSSLGHQPMADNNKEIYLVFNGEIYNYIEIRDELKEQGYTFLTNCDTEVIIYAYKEWGFDCVKRFNGMWAFALWDNRRKILFCSRDRMGVKPFYYYKDKYKFLFGSEIKQILQDNSIERVANGNKVYDYLVFNIVDNDEETFFKNIYNLPGGHNLVINLDSTSDNYGFLQMERYWDLNSKTSNLSYEEAVNEIKIEIERSVRWRLRSDVPVGSCLSGGLDSSSIVCLAAKELVKKGEDVTKFNTFTACYNEDKEVDERLYSQEVVKEVGCKEVLVFPTLDCLKEDITNLIWHQDEPFVNLSIFAQWCVMKSANEHGIKVLLDGQGGDEALLGYERYYTFYLNNLLSEGKIIKFFKEFRNASLNSKLSIKDVCLFYFYFSFKTLRFFRANLVAKKVCNNSFLKKNKQRQEVLNIYIKYFDIKELHKSEILCMNLPSLLRYEDRNSMAFSIESRVPFVDYQFIEKCLELPYDYKIRDGWSKIILRDALKDILPGKVRLRKDKLGFAAPQNRWLAELKGYILEIFSKEIRCKNYINQQMVLNAVKENSSSSLVWKALCLELWMREFNVQ